MLQKTDSNIETKLEDAPITRKKGIISRLKKPIYSFLAGIVLLSACGCATTSNSAIFDSIIQEETKLGYAFHDRRGDLKIVSRNNDLYIEKIDGSESRRITHTPDIKETCASFTKDGQHIVYSILTEDKTLHKMGRYYGLVGSICYLQPRDEDSEKRIKIHKQEFLDFKYERYEN